MEAYLRSRASLFRSILAHISHSNKPPIVQRRSPLVERHLAARHQNWALRVPNDALGDATYEPALYGPQPPAAHNDQAEPALLITELEYLFVRVPHPQVRLRDRPSNLFYLLYGLIACLLGLLTDLTQGASTMGKILLRTWSDVEVLHVPDVKHVQLRVADVCYVARHLGGLRRVLGGIGCQQDLRRKRAHLFRPFLHQLWRHSINGTTSRANF